MGDTATGETALTDTTPDFPTTRKGYDRAAVDAFIGSLRDQLAGLRDDLAKARDELGVTQEELTAAQSDLDELRADIDTAKTVAAEEANRLLGDAQANATATTEAAERRASEIAEAAEENARERREAVESEENEMRERLRTRENEITAELDEIDARVGERTRLVADLEQRLAAEELRYADRIQTLKTVAQGLEDALRAVAEGSLLELGVFLHTQRAAIVDNDIVGAGVHHHFTTDALLAASPQPAKPTPPPAATTAHGPADSAPVEREERQEAAPRPGGSFYSRRSARLPSMGETQGPSILAQMGALRKDDDSDDDTERNEA